MANWIFVLYNLADERYNPFRLRYKKKEISVPDDSLDAKRYQWLKNKLIFVLSSYDGPDCLKNASSSVWSFKTTGLFNSSNSVPSSIDEAIDEAMKGDLENKI